MRLLFLYPQDICYGIVHSFMDNLACALEKEGVCITKFDSKTTSPQNILNLLHEKFDAVVDFYSGMVGSGDGNGGYLFDVFDCPVYQLCLDYPLYISDRIDVPLKKHYVLCGNDRYIPVIKGAMPHIKKSFFFPMTGISDGKPKPFKERTKDVVFIGTYNDYREYLNALEGLDGDIRLLARTLFDVMVEDVNLDQKEAMNKTLLSLNIDIGENESYEWFKVIGEMARGAFAYHRERIVETIVSAGIKLHVFGDSWKNSPFKDNPNVIINPAVDEQGYVDVLSDTKVSVNVMYANRSGYTERYGYSMLNGAVCVSDKSDYICKNFEDGKEIVYYNLQTLSDLPDKINRLLSNPDEALKISLAAYEKACGKHTWESRAESLLILHDWISGAHGNSQSLIDFFSDENRREKYLTADSKMRYLDILAMIAEEEIKSQITPRFFDRFSNDKEFIDYWNHLRFMAFRYVFSKEEETLSQLSKYVLGEGLSPVVTKYLILTASFSESQKSLLNRMNDEYGRAGQ